METSPDLATLRLRSDTHRSVASVLELVDDERQYACLRDALRKPPPADRSGGYAGGPRPNHDRERQDHWGPEEA